MTVLDIKSICSLGGSVIVSANDFTPLDLKGIALIAKSSGAKIIIKNASRLSSLSCRGIVATVGQGVVTFDFVD